LCQTIFWQSSLLIHFIFWATRRFGLRLHAIATQHGHHPERFTICLIDQHLADQPGQVVAKYLAENRAKNVVLFGKLDNAENRLSLYQAGVSLILRDPDGTAEIVAAMSSMATPAQTPVTKRASVVSFPSKTSGTSVPWQVKALQRELVAPSGQVVALTRNEVKVCCALAGLIK
jgi:DNA-binding NarL/FixJ family response regulator